MPHLSVLRPAPTTMVVLETALWRHPRDVKGLGQNWRIVKKLTFVYVNLKGSLRTHWVLNSFYLAKVCIVNADIFFRGFLETFTTYKL